MKLFFKIFLTAILAVCFYYIWVVTLVIMSLGGVDSFYWGILTSGMILLLLYLLSFVWNILNKKTVNIIFVAVLLGMVFLTAGHIIDKAVENNIAQIMMR